MDDGKAFELGLRRIADEAFDKDPNPASYWAKFHDGALTFEECRTLYYERWPFVMEFNRRLLPLLISKAPTLKSRTEVLAVVHPEFGSESGHPKAHPVMYRNFLSAMGMSDAELDWNAIPKQSPTSPPPQQDWTYLARLSWIELLAHMLFIETVGPVLFGREGEILHTKYGVSEDAIEYFEVHSVHDKIDSELLFAQVRREARTEEERQAAAEMMRKSYVLMGARVGRWPGTTSYRFVRRFDRRFQD
jgi:pyrroloquinoline quinone (PQQ) biosynthesis protein C